MSRRGWVWIALLAAAFIALHWNFVLRTYFIAIGQWGGDWSHALAVPFIAIYYICLKRDDLAALQRRTCWPGLAILFLGIFSYTFWIAPGRNDMLQGYSMILGLFGLVLFLLGPSMMRVLWFPILYLSLGVKISDRIWENIAAKLQALAAQTATLLLNILGKDAEVHGTIITLYRAAQRVGDLNVEEACAGLRMLMAFIALGVAVAFLFDREWWQRLTMVLFTVPIAIGINVGRVTIMGLLYYINPSLSMGDFHKFVGLLMLIPALLLFMFLGWVLDRIFINDTPPRRAQANIPAPPTTAETPARPDWIIAGLACGSGLTLLIGGCYFLFLASVKPGFMGAAISLTTSRVALGVAIAATIAAVVFIRRFTRSGDGSMPAPTSFSGRSSVISTALVGGVLFTSVLGIYGVLWANDVILHKDPLPLRKQLFMIPEQLGTWKMVSQDPPLSAETIETLGTNEYIARTYNDTSRSGAGSTVKLHLAYYTGTPDTVPHVPDRCWVAGGMQHMGLSFLPLPLPAAMLRGEPDGSITANSKLAGPVHVPSRNIDATIFTYASPQHGDKPSNVVYFFVANGKFLASPDAVRYGGFNPRDKYAFYCKVEIGMADVPDRDDAVKHAAAFLSAALPDILACLPDWHEVETGQWPVAPGKK
ncbi:MAG: exosortase [Planctomycetes bacterium]|nr:exosortase [Planctomycetota bacterium]